MLLTLKELDQIWIVKYTLYFNFVVHGWTLSSPRTLFLHITSVFHGYQTHLVLSFHVWGLECGQDWLKAQTTFIFSRPLKDCLSSSDLNWSVIYADTQQQISLLEVDNQKQKYCDKIINFQLWTFVSGELFKLVLLLVTVGSCWYCSQTQTGHYLLTVESNPSFKQINSCLSKWEFKVTMLLKWLWDLTRIVLFICFHLVWER